MLSPRNLTTAIVWGRMGVLMLEFMKHGATIMSQVYFKTHTKNYKAIQNRRCKMLTSCILIITHVHILL